MCDVCDSDAIVSYGGEDYDIGLCGRCSRDRGVEYSLPSPGYVSPDDAERNPEHYDRVEAKSRARVLGNAANNPRF